MKFLLIAMIQLYRFGVSPVVHALCGPGCGCRFEPSCSLYFLESLRRHGGWRGFRLGISRVARCHPWGGSGFDPVPPREVTLLSTWTEKAGSQ